MNTSKIKLINVTSINKACKPLKLNELKKNEYVTKHYINKNSILCQRNLKEYKKESVIFSFGSIEIEKNGKVINENQKYIIIKNENGKREKIYKDGSLK